MIRRLQRIVGGFQCIFEEEHNWKSEWEYESSNSCLTVYVCKRCGTRKRRSVEVHEWGSREYLSAGSCLQKVTCKRCGAVRNLTEEVIHSWGEPKYLRERDCTREFVCERCKGVHHSTGHDWGEWIEASEEESEQLGLADLKRRKCNRCGETDTSYDPYKNNPRYKAIGGEYGTTYEINYDYEEPDDDTDD